MQQGGGAEGAGEEVLGPGEYFNISIHLGPGEYFNVSIYLGPGENFSVPGPI